jgi:hypothetical protein
MRRLSVVPCIIAGALLTGCGGSDKALLSDPTTPTTSTAASATVLSLGSGSGASFSAGAIAISATSLSAGGSTSLQVSLVDQHGNPYTTSTAITFSSPCAGQGLATIAATGVTPASPTVTTTTGTASATYVATGCSGKDVITASATANSQSLTANGTVSVAQAAIGSISAGTPNPTSITLKGASGGSATSTIVFTVLDTSGGPRAGATVTMSLNSTVGGITAAPTTAVSDASGKVQTIVSSGTVATTVRVTATTQTAAGATISTESNSLTISTGIPTSNNISLAVQCPNVEAYGIQGVSVPVTVAMTDRFSNPVPAGTTANFVTTLGGIDASCQTVNATGTCQVNWHSQAPYSIAGNPATTKGTAYTNPNWCGPANSPYCNGTTNGRSEIIVTAIGEESFVDANGNGIFDPADTVAFDPANADNNFASGLPKPWQDTQEPFLNQWELYDQYGTPQYVSGEFFIDFNKNGTHDGPDGLFNGALCEGPLCNTQNSVAIGAQNLIILSGSHANFTLVGTPTVGQPISMYVYDDRFQPMPNGSTVLASFTPTTAGTVVSGPSTIPCSFATPIFDPSGNVVSAGTLLTFATSQSTTPTSGTMYVTVTTPGLQLGKVSTTIAIPVSN